LRRGRLPQLGRRPGGPIDLVIDTDLNKIPNGGNIINEAQKHNNIIVQHLKGEHEEIAALINLKPNTTLDADNNQSTQAFYLDAWYINKQAKDLGISENSALFLSLGLYIATEMVLVEDRKNIRLPIVVNK